MKVLILLALIALTASVQGYISWKSESNHLYSFHDYKQEFNKIYTDEFEHEIRSMIFNENLKKIREINSNPANTWKAGVNQFTDMNAYEFKQHFGLNRPLKFYTKSATYVSPAFNHKTDFLVENPKSIDWREKNILNPVRNQGACGSCWAFATIAVSEAHVAKETGSLFSLSEQQLVDCAPNPHHCGGTGGCEGSIEPLGFEYIHSSGGYVTRDNYKYTAKDGKCVDNTFERVATIDGFAQTIANDPQSLEDTLARKGPVTVSVAASAWQFYSSGIFNSECGYETNHAVTLVAYGEEENGAKYWTIRNSWGTSWGEEGHIRLPKEDDLKKDIKCGWDKDPKSGSACDGSPDKVWVCGQCGMYSESSYPVGAKLK